VRGRVGPEVPVRALAASARALPRLSHRNSLSVITVCCSATEWGEATTTVMALLSNRDYAVTP
jgi:hypothetical protein